MAPASTALTTKVESGSPYQLSEDQTLVASRALLAHIASNSDAAAEKPDLLDSDETDDSPVIYLNLTTKHQISEQKRLKPAKIALPHPLNTASSISICLIVADPSSLYQERIDSPAFPASLRPKIGRVVDINRIKKEYKQYEQQRQLKDQYDVFLCDDRVIPLLPKLLGKTFYGTAQKRPIPVRLSPAVERSDGKKIAKAKGETPKASNPKDMAAEITKALHATVVNLGQATNTMVKVGHASWEPEHIAENVKAVAEAMIERFVTKKWRGVKSIHIKSAESMALPIWLADELWVEDGDVLDEEGARQLEEASLSKKAKKRKARALTDAAPEALEDDTEELSVVKKKEKTSKKLKLAESDDTKLDREIALRKEKLKKQKAEALAEFEDDIPKATEKPKKDKKKSKKVSA